MRYHRYANAKGEWRAQLDTGLEWAFLVLLVTLVGAGWFMAKARSTYARDVATAAAAADVTPQPAPSS